jgi:UDP-2,3-diacylglucosamine pyrophosphatase LpxH
MKNHYRSIFISDIHLGSSHCQSEILLGFLKEYKCDTLYLVGDIIDFWKLKRRFKITSSQVAVLQKILKLSKKGTTIKYVLGNHDADIRPFLKYNINIENIEIANEFVHESVDMKKYLVIHGDFCDFLSTSAKWVTYLGDHAYTVALNFNDMVNFIRKKIGMPYFSVSRYLKQNVKEAVGFVFDFEKTIAEYAKKRKFAGVIAGHIHTAEIKFVDDILYMNDGDFQESCSALCETYEGNFIIVHYILGKWTTTDIYNIANNTVSNIAK